MKIGILQTGHVPEELAQEFGEYPSMFSRFLADQGLEFVTFSVVDGTFPTSIRDADGWLITGSRHGSYEDHPWIPPLEDFIREAYAAEVPLVGICFGHQIMAQALGGKVEKFGGIWGVGNRTYQHHDGSEITLLAMHQDQVVEVPPEATVTASSEYCRNAAFSYKGKAWSIQPHPEFTPDFMKKLIEMRAGKIIPQDQADDGLSSLNISNDSERVAKEIAEFFKASVASPVPA